MTVVQLILGDGQPVTKQLQAVPRVGETVVWQDTVYQVADVVNDIDRFTVSIILKLAEEDTDTIDPAKGILVLGKFLKKGDVVFMEVNLGGLVEAHKVWIGYIADAGHGIYPEHPDTCGIAKVLFTRKGMPLVESVHINALQSYRLYARGVMSKKDADV